VVGAGFAVEEGREDVGQVDLARALEVALGAIEALRHDAEVDILRADDVADLADHLVDAYVGTGVARAIVAGEEEFEFFAGSPSFADSQHPSQAGEFDQHADPGDEEKVGHAREAPLTVVMEAFCDGHGLTG
jgi:hypothetical protein